MGVSVRVGLTGSSGLIGRAVANALRERGDGVVRFIRPTTGASSGETVRWDPANGRLDEADLHRVGGLDAVINLAGAGIGDHRWSAQRKAVILDSRVASTTLLVEAIGAMASGVRMVVSGSAVGVYGSRGDEILDETSTPGTDFLADVCQRWEAAAQPVSRLGTELALVRTGIVMSSLGGALRRQLPIFRWGLGGVLGDGTQWISSIALADEVRAILWILDHGLTGPHNVVGPEPTTNRQFTKALGAALHSPTIVPVPAFALSLALGAPLAHGAVLASQRVVPNRLLASGFEYTYPDLRSTITAAIGA